MNIECNVVLQNALDHQRDEKSSTEVTENNVSPPDLSVSWDKNNIENDDSEHEESTPASFAG